VRTAVQLHPSIEAPFFSPPASSLKSRPRSFPNTPPCVRSEHTAMRYVQTRPLCVHCNTPLCVVNAYIRYRYSHPATSCYNHADFPLARPVWRCPILPLGPAVDSSASRACHSCVNHVSFVCHLCVSCASLSQVITRRRSLTTVSQWRIYISRTHTPTAAKQFSRHNPAGLATSVARFASPGAPRLPPPSPPRYTPTSVFH
jgi:hypothetical protein